MLQRYLTQQDEGKTFSREGGCSVKMLNVGPHNAVAVERQSGRYFLFMLDGRGYGATHSLIEQSHEGG
ncbi:hypothetical protein PsAD13_03178 [Pseudovibrio sp. Ad13]|uniref:hypothetical protein n=1 Tax=Pseudovibrio sp. Ad13 TaxID=989396 RepID=UPI0007AE9352|nr:hypothetical protein [Pseudovibrio sp. Ad13]KZK82976.1 hypothetical protein PsAD13_03178 [Pseudovibrio sp. Ad13]